MEDTLTLATLLRSCTVLFGHQLHISRDFLDYLQISGVRSAYRKRARETHPDLAGRMVGIGCGTSPDSFHCVQESYENLKFYIKKRDDILLQSTSSGLFGKPSGRWSDSANRPFAAGAEYAAGKGEGWDLSELEWDYGCFPSRKMMLGDCLYFARVAGWQDVIRALVWQKASRPRLGDLGCTLGWLQQKDIPHIIKAYRPGRRFGEIAVQLGLIDRQRRDRLVFYQKCRQQKIGQYFVAKGFLTEQELLMYIKILRRHNGYYPA